MTGILAKRPSPGRAKTRLTPGLSPEEAAGLAEAMLEDALIRGDLAAAASRQRLVFAPAQDEAWFHERYANRVALAPQEGQDLAHRLEAFLTRALLEPGVATVVAVGSDAPLVPASRLAEAHVALEQGADLVLGPDLGGGYYLIGLREPHPELLLEVEMSTPTMARDTLALARARGLSVTMLAAEYDIDVEDDLQRLVLDLTRRDPETPDFPRSTAAFLRNLPVS